MTLLLVEECLVPFRAGLTKYLNAHAFGTAVTDDFWAAVEEAWSEAKHKKTRDRDRYVRNVSNDVAAAGTASSAVADSSAVPTVIQEINMVGRPQGIFNTRFAGALRRKGWLEKN